MDTFVVLRGWRESMEAQGRLSARTRRQYMRTVIGFLVDHPKPLREITAADIQSSVLAIGDHPAQRNMLLQALKSMYRYAAKAHGIADPTEDFVVRKLRPRGPPDYLSREELERLFTAAERVDPRARPTMELMYATAARVHSVTELRPEDVDLRLRRVHFGVVKNDAPYTVPLSPRAYGAVLALLDLVEYHPRTGVRVPGRLVGVGDERVRQWMQKAARIAELDRRVYPHLLRHSSLTHLANDPSVSVAVVVATAGWQNPEPYKHYVLADEQRWKQALAKL